MIEYEHFCRESNAIEGEYDSKFSKDDLADMSPTQRLASGRLNPGDMKAIDFALDANFSEVENILKLHGMLGEYLNKNWVGSWRTINVRVGRHIPPSHELVPARIKLFVEKFSSMNAREAHNEFETVHPFQDLNGRTGRLIWLSKSITEGFDFRLSFLHSEYYRDLDGWRK